MSSLEQDHLLQTRIWILPARILGNKPEEIHSAAHSIPITILSIPLDGVKARRTNLIYECDHILTEETIHN